MLVIKKTSFFMPLVAALIWQLPSFITWSSSHLDHYVGNKNNQQECSGGEFAVDDTPKLVGLQPQAAPTNDLYIENDDGLEDFDRLLQPMHRLLDETEVSTDKLSQAVKNSRVYIRPDVSTFYGEEPGKMVAKKHSFNGQAGKFINMSPDRLKLFWDPKNGQDGVLISTVGPFEATGTATFPGHRFYLANPRTGDEVVARFAVVANKSIYVHDPYRNPRAEGHQRSVEELSAEQLKMYSAQRDNLEYAERYKEATGGTEWLSMHPRNPPVHPMWKADYFGQEHHVQTRETHFVALPPDEALGRITAEGSARRLDETSPRLLQEYRSPEQSLDLTLSVVSCAPRIYEISNFLSDVEVDYILSLAHRMNLRRSTTGSGNGDSERTKVRTSMNSWVNREESPIIDSVYRRAADVLRIDEALLRQRGDDEDEWDHLGTKRSVAEALQLVHYDVRQEYTAHHDFGYPSISKKNAPNRHANIILYLNHVEEGGETSFPRWLNAETSSPIKVVPEKGKAVLFYSLLPDGNSDDLSQHAAMPVIRGEKWMTNLWVWDPYRD